MKVLIAALVLAALISVPTFAAPANATPVFPGCDGCCDAQQHSCAAVW
jgi:hypothetical protein